MYHKPQKNAPLQHLSKFVRQSINHKAQITILAFFLIFSFVATTKADSEKPIQVSFGSNNNYLMEMAFDENENTFLLWWSEFTLESNALKIQKLDSLGKNQWQSNGICFTATNEHSQAIVLPDNNEGCDIIYRTGWYFNGKIYLQNINANGEMKYQVPGKQIANTAETNSQTHAVAIRLANSNIFCCWYNGTEDEGNDYLYSQIFDTDGNYVWASNGVQLLSRKLGGRANDVRPAVCESDTDIVIVAQTLLDDSTYDLYAQKINKDGVLLWGNNGMPVCTASNQQEYVSVAADINNNIFVVWDDLRRMFKYYDVYVQCLDSTGSNIWQVNGVTLTDTTSTGIYFSAFENKPSIVKSGNSTVYVTWQDFRNENPDIYAQKVTRDEVYGWQTNALPICTETKSQHDAMPFIDSIGNLSVFWGDVRSGSDSLYHQIVNPIGDKLLEENGEMVIRTSNSFGYYRAKQSGENYAVGWVEETSLYKQVFAQIYIVPEPVFLILIIVGIIIILKNKRCLIIAFIAFISLSSFDLFAGNFYAYNSGDFDSGFIKFGNKNYKSYLYAYSTDVYENDDTYFQFYNMYDSSKYFLKICGDKTKFRGGITIWHTKLDMTLKYIEHLAMPATPLSHHAANVQFVIDQISSSISDMATKTWCNSQFDTSAEVDSKGTTLITWVQDNYYTQPVSDGRYYTRTVADSRYFTQPQVVQVIDGF